MKLKRNLVQLVQSDYTPLQTSAEGLLRGGFGSVTIGSALSAEININICKNPKCANGECTNPDCSNQCTINYCSPTTPSASPSPSAASAALCFGL